MPQYGIYIIICLIFKDTVRLLLTILAQFKTKIVDIFRLLHHFLKLALFYVVGDFTGIKTTVYAPEPKAWILRSLHKHLLQLLMGEFSACKTV